MAAAGRSIFTVELAHIKDATDIETRCATAITNLPANFFGAELVVSRPPSVENGAIGLLGIVAAVVAYQNAWITVTGSVVKAIKTNDLTGAALDAAVDAIVTTQEGSSRHLRNSVSINFPSARGVDSYLIMLFTTGTPATS